MTKEKLIVLVARISLVSAMLVVLAGSVVRMTGSGMGCPDWPKCFGYYIPPTELEEVLWQPDTFFKKGRMIVHEEAIWVAKADFTSSEQLSLSNWEKYTRHDYAIFNPFHTWTEYINRLIGAFTGLPVLLTVGLSFFFFRKSVFIPLLALFSLFVLGFEAWLGKVVVDGNLIPNQITIHMFGALVLVACLLLLIRLLKGSGSNADVVKANVWFIAGLVFVTLLQVLMGTNIREEVDLLNKSGVARADWIESLPGVFDVHRSFSIAVFIANGLLLFKLMKSSMQGVAFFWGGILIIEILLGLGLTYLGFPSWMQPLHLVLAFVLFAVQFDVLSKVLGGEGVTPSTQKTQ